MLTAPQSSRKSNAAAELVPDVGLWSQADSVAEIAELLALALSRMKAGKARELSDHRGDSSLDTLAHQSGHPASSKRRMTNV